MSDIALKKIGQPRMSETFNPKDLSVEIEVEYRENLVARPTPEMLARNFEICGGLSSPPCWGLFPLLPQPISKSLLYDFIGGNHVDGQIAGIEELFLIF